MDNKGLIDEAKQVMKELAEVDNGRMLSHEQSAYYLIEKLCDELSKMDRENKRLHGVICAAASAIKDDDEKYSALRILLVESEGDFDHSA